MQKQSTTFPANPVYYSANDQTIWSYISFGSYPQTEVTGEALTPQIIGSLYDSDGNAWIDSTKYRRISRDDTTDNEFFGKNEYFRYFKWEKIRWRVLQNDGKTLFVMADTALDSRAFNIGYDRSVTWENCTLRKWLNNDFYNMAFDSKEQESILLSDVSQSPGAAYRHRNSGNDTKDKIYLLSIAEATNPAYGFRGNIEDAEKSSDKQTAYKAEQRYYDEGEDTEQSFMHETRSRMLKASDYAHAMGAWMYTDKRNWKIYKKYWHNCKWWLRTSCKYTKEGAIVIKEGDISDTGYTAYILQTAVVPVMHISIESDSWSILKLQRDEMPQPTPAVICL